MFTTSSLMKHLLRNDFMVNDETNIFSIKAIKKSNTRLIVQNNPAVKKKGKIYGSKWNTEI